MIDWFKRLKVSHKTLLFLILIAVLSNPFDLAVPLNRALGIRGHLIVYGILVAFILYNIPGKTLSSKWHRFMGYFKER